MLEELMGLLITLSTRQNEKKPSASASTSATSPPKQGLERFNEEVAIPIMRGAIGLIRSYDFLIDLLTVAFQTPLQNQESVDYQSLIDQKVTSLIR